MVKLTDAEIEGAIEAALDSIPDGLQCYMENLAVVIQDEPVEDYENEGKQSEGGLLGLYDGLPLTERGEEYGSLCLDYPDVITIFQGPHERISDSKEVVLEEVRKTVIHEVGHFFGMSEEQIARMGYE